MLSYHFLSYEYENSEALKSVFIQLGKKAPVTFSTKQSITFKISMTLSLVRFAFVDFNNKEHVKYYKIMAKTYVMISTTGFYLHISSEMMKLR